ncbi:MAG: MarC family protein [Planctomycetota bacterium]
MDKLIAEFIFFFTVIDPVGTVPVFLAATAGVAAHYRAKIAWRAFAISAILLVLSVVLGQITLEYLSINFAAFRVAGGVILFMFALNMIFGDSKPDSEIAEAEAHSDEALDKAVYPLAIPSIAGPGAMMAAIVRTDNQLYGLSDQVLTVAIILAVLGIVLACMLLATRIERLIGRSGASVVSRVMGLLFAAIAADGVMTGIRDYFGLA